MVIYQAHSNCQPPLSWSPTQPSALSGIRGYQSQGYQSSSQHGLTPNCSLTACDEQLSICPGCHHNWDGLIPCHQDGHQLNMSYFLQSFKHQTLIYYCNTTAHLKHFRLYGCSPINPLFMLNFLSAHLPSLYMFTFLLIYTLSVPTMLINCILILHL